MSSCYCLFATGKGFIAEAEKLPRPPEILSEWQKLEEEYILPGELVDQTLHAETYHEAISQIFSMAAEGKGNSIN